MSVLKLKYFAVAAALALSSGVALAQAPAAQPSAAPTPAAPAPSADTGPAVAPVKKSGAARTSPAQAANRSPESLACSAELDAKGIHGKAAGRRTAMRKCVAEAKRPGSTTPTAAKK